MSTFSFWEIIAKYFMQKFEHGSECPTVQTGKSHEIRRFEMIFYMCKCKLMCFHIFMEQKEHSHKILKFYLFQLSFDIPSETEYFVDIR